MDTDSSRVEIVEQCNARVVALYQAAKLAEALPIARRAVELCASMRDHPVRATSLNNLAYLLQAQGDLAGAEPLYR
jgi:hypothetical protein